MPVVGIVILKSGLRVYVEHPADNLADAGYQVVTCPMSATTAPATPS